MNRRRRHASLAGRTRRLMEQANDSPSTRLHVKRCLDPPPATKAGPPLSDSDALSPPNPNQMQLSSASRGSAEADDGESLACHSLDTVLCTVRGARSCRPPVASTVINPFKSGRWSQSISSGSAGCATSPRLLSGTAPGLLQPHPHCSPHRYSYCNMLPWFVTTEASLEDSAMF